MDKKINLKPEKFKNTVKDLASIDNLLAQYDLSLQEGKDTKQLANKLKAYQVITFSPEGKTYLLNGQPRLLKKEKPQGLLSIFSTKQKFTFDIDIPFKQINFDKDENRSRSSQMQSAIQNGMKNDDFLIFENPYGITALNELKSWLSETNQVLKVKPLYQIAELFKVSSLYDFMYK